MRLGLFVIMSFIYIRTEAARSKQQNDNNLYRELKNVINIKHYLYNVV